MLENDDTGADVVVVVVCVDGALPPELPVEGKLRGFRFECDDDELGMDLTDDLLARVEHELLDEDEVESILLMRTSSMLGEHSFAPGRLIACSSRMSGSVRARAAISSANHACGTSSAMGSRWAGLAANSFLINTRH